MQEPRTRMMLAVVDKRWGSNKKSIVGVGIVRIVLGDGERLPRG